MSDSKLDNTEDNGLHTTESVSIVQIDSSALLGQYNRLGFGDCKLPDDDPKRDHKDACREGSVFLGKGPCKAFSSSKRVHNATEQDAENCIRNFRSRIEGIGSGEATVRFSRTVLMALGETDDINDSQKLTIEGICSVMEELRPFPGTLWVDFVRGRLDTPKILRQSLRACLPDTSLLELRIRDQMKTNESKIQPFMKSPVLVLGRSATVAAALSGLTEPLQSGLKVVSTIEGLAEQNVPTRPYTRKPLHRVLPGVQFEEIEHTTGIEGLSSGKFGMAFMGCNVVAVRWTKQLEVIVSRGQQELVDAAVHGGVPICIVAGTYKLWPTITYEKHRPSAVVSSEYAILAGSRIKWLLTEDGIMDLDNVPEYYDVYFKSAGIPTAPIRYALELQDATETHADQSRDFKDLAPRVDSILNGLQLQDEDKLREGKVTESLPPHYRLAKKRYQELKEEDRWLLDHMGKYVAIVGQVVVEEANSMQELTRRVRDKYGYGPIFMRRVTIDDDYIRNATLSPAVLREHHA